MRRLIFSTTALFLVLLVGINCKFGDKQSATKSPGSAAQVAPAAVEDIDVATFKALAAKADSNTVILDVRTPAEYNAGSIPGSILIDINSREFQSKITKLDRDKTYLVYCRTGNRSSTAARIMTRQLGFTDVKNLVGGYVQYMRQQ